MANPFVHIELQTRDVAAARTFYQQLFDWKIEALPVPDGKGAYTMIDVGEGTGGGMFPNTDAPPQWLAYVGVDDIRASTDKARALGATIACDVMEVGGYGWMSVIVDPGGATLGLWQSKPQPA